MNLLEAFEELNKITEYIPTVKHEVAKPINLSDCRMISTDVIDNRGNTETNACLYYTPGNTDTPVLTRVQVRVVVKRQTENGVEFLGKLYRGRGRVLLPGGGYDIKDGDVIETAKRELWEESNIEITNVQDTNKHYWDYRDDSWVKKHVADPADRWYGYYTFMITADYAGTSNNDNPEELGSWKWLPIDKLSQRGKDLDEAVYARNEEDPDMSDLSYMVESPEQLARVLSTLEIKKTFIEESDIGSFDSDSIDDYTTAMAVNKGRGHRVKSSVAKAAKNKFYSVSTSSNVGGHAERKPDRWGFGIIIDGKILSRYYKTYDFAHTAVELLKNEITGVIKLKEPLTLHFNNKEINARYFMRIANYNWYFINEKWYEALIKVLQDGSWPTLRAFDLDNNLTINDVRRLFFTAPQIKNNDMPKEFIDNDKKSILEYISNTPDLKFHYRLAKNTIINNEQIIPSNIQALYKFDDVADNRKIGSPLKVKQLNDWFGSEQFAEFRRWLQAESRFNEHEKRIWLTNPNIQFVKLPIDTIKGIVLPSYFEKDWESQTPKQPALAYIKRRFEELNIKPEVKYHNEYHDKYKDIETNKTELTDITKDLAYYEKQLDNLKIVFKEANELYTTMVNNNQKPGVNNFKYFSKDNNNMSQAFKNTLTYRVYNTSNTGSKMDLCQLIVGELIYNCACYNIEKYMVGNQNNNYDDSYKEAFAETKKEIIDILGKLVNLLTVRKQLAYIAETFAYYAPERADWQNKDFSSLPEASWNFDSIDHILNTIK